MTIADNVASVRARIREAALGAGRDPGEVRLLAASKQQPVYKIREALAAGVDAVGENRVQEMLQKTEAYTGAALHFIGRLQKNKVKSVVGRVSLIHSVDDFELAERIAHCAEAQHMAQDVLLEVNIADEPSKGGFPAEAVEEALARIVQMPALRARGLMCIPPPPEGGGSGDGGGKNYFSKMRQLYVDIRPKIVDNRNSHVLGGFDILSMGMSGDYAQAVAYGSTLVRVGGAIFGERSANT